MEKAPPQVCCARGCYSSSKTDPFRQFYTLTKVRGSLSAFNQRNILGDLKIRRNAPGGSFSICDMHFPNIQQAAAPKTDDRGRIKSSNKETQTDRRLTAPNLMITPVEIVDIPPTIPASVPILDAFPIPGMIGPSILGALGGINPETQSNNNIPGFIGTIAQPEPMSVLVPGPVTSRNAKPPVSRETHPKTPGPVMPGYIVDLNSLQFTPPMINIVNMRGLETTNDHIQQRVGNINVAVANTSTSGRPRMDADEVEIIDDALQTEDPIKIEDDDELADSDVEYETNTDKSELENDTVRIQFPSNDAEPQDDEHYVKFEIEESSEAMETYCFFDDDNEDTAKRRKVESADSGFQIVKLEVDPDRTII